MKEQRPRTIPEEGRAGLRNGPGDPIALLLPCFGQGGVFRSTLNLAEALTEGGWAAEIWVGEDATARSFVPLPAGVEILRLGRIGQPAFHQALVGTLRQRRPLAIFSALHAANVAALVARAEAAVKTRVAVGVRVTTSQRRAVAELAEVRAEMARYYPAAEAIIACSFGVREDTARCSGISRDRICVVSNAIVSRHLEALAGEPLDHPWFARGAPPVILGVGRLAPYKAFATLIKAFRRVRDVVPCRLLILGEGGQRPLLEALIARLSLSSAVALPGYVRNPYKYMSRAAVFVSSSRSEGLANVLVEALACGTPVVAADCESGPAEVLEDGRFGRLVSVGDSFELASAILASLEAPYDRAASRARAAEWSARRAAAGYLSAVGLAAAPASLP